MTLHPLPSPPRPTHRLPRTDRRGRWLRSTLAALATLALLASGVVQHASARQPRRGQTLATAGSSGAGSPQVRGRRDISRLDLWRARLAAHRDARRQRRATRTPLRKKLSSLVASGVALSILAAPTTGLATSKATHQTVEPQRHELRLASQPRGIKDGVVTVQSREGVQRYRVLPAERGKASELVSLMRGALVKLARKQLYREHKLTIYDLELGEHAGVAFQLKARPVAGDDARITGDAHRAALTRQMKAAGTPVTWLQVGGGILPSAGFTIPLSNGHVGFAADAMVGYSVLAPYQLRPGAVVEAGKNISVDLPVTWNKARSLADGTVVRLVGKARYVVHGGAGGGETLATLGSLATVGAHVGVGASRVREGNVQLEIHKRGKQVHVRVSEVGGTARNGWIGAHVGLDAHVARGLPAADSAATRRALGLVYKQLDRTLEKYVKASVRSTTSSARSDKVIAAYSFQGDGRDVARAYEQLVRFAPDRADRLATRPGSGVARSRLEERGSTVSRGVRAHVGPWKVIAEISSSELRHGTLRHGRGTLTYDRARLSDGSTGILPALWKGKREVSREYVTVTYPGQQEAHSYLRVHHTVKKDRFTRTGDVRPFKNLAEYLGARIKGKDHAARKLGKTDRVVDVYITDAGLKKLAATRPEVLLRAYSEVYKTIDRPWDMNYLIGGNKGVWKENPWMVTNHPRHADLVRWLEQGPERRTHRPGDTTATARITRQQRYRTITGRSLAFDSAAYKEGQRLVELVAQLRRAGSPAERARVFARADRQLGIDFWKELATLAHVAGHEQVLVNKMAIHGENGRSITYLHEGAIRDPQTVVQQQLANPR